MNNQFITSNERSDKSFSKKSSLENETSYVEMECYLANTSKYGNLITEIFLIDGIVKNIIFSTEKPYVTETRLYTNKYGHETEKKQFLITGLGRYVLLILKRNVTLLRDVFRQRRFPPYVELFLDHVMDNKLGILIGVNCHYSDEENEKVAGVINEFVGSLRKKAQSKEFEKKLNGLNRSVRENHKNLLSYIDILFKQYARLLVLRVDLDYEKGNYIKDEHEICAKYNEAKQDFEHFLNNMRSNTLFDNMVGYVWKLEYGSFSGYHYHVIFFFDGSKVREDESIAMMIGEYWKEIITKGRGRYYNCNDKKEFYTRCGIGMINHYDTKLIENLKMVSEYITKSDYYFKAIVPKKGKAFGKGGIPKPKSNRGRPRKEKPSKHANPNSDAANLPL